MSIRIATFNAENLMQRFDFTGFRDTRYRDRTLSMVQIKDQAEYERFEKGRVIAHSDDTLQLTALAVAKTNADIICLQEVENLQAIDTFEYSYLYRMVGSGYRNKYLLEGNDGRGIDVAVMTRDETVDGEKIEMISVKSHKDVTYDDFDLMDDDLREMGEKAHEKVFRRDCLEVNLKVGGKQLTLFVVHFKSMGPSKDGTPGRDYTMPVRRAEAKAVRRIIENRFGDDNVAKKRWMVCGDLNDYRRRIVVHGDMHKGYNFSIANENHSGFDTLVDNGFSENLVERLDPMQQWTFYHSRGPQEQHLCQLDYLLASPALAERNPNALPEIIRAGQPHRTVFPPDQAVERFPRTGWDRPKASDHCPVVVKLNIV